VHPCGRPLRHECAALARRLDDEEINSAGWQPCPPALIASGLGILGRPVSATQLPGVAACHLHDDLTVVDRHRPLGSVLSGTQRARGVRFGLGWTGWLVIRAIDRLGQLGTVIHPLDRTSNRLGVKEMVLESSVGNRPYACWTPSSKLIDTEGGLYAKCPLCPCRI
jgi:hypothetical protein